jgi:hypothetical protein
MTVFGGAFALFGPETPKISLPEGSQIP